mmetsp:Transcript_73433/g.174997  ORF Transcript_73433/g.174997 Transcript_73433/m.174997 type:complete len:267 (+) Transcript_73433:562-1362(+)
MLPPRRLKRLTRLGRKKRTRRRRSPRSRQTIARRRMSQSARKAALGVAAARGRGRGVQSRGDPDPGARGTEIALGIVPETEEIEIRIGTVIVTDPETEIVSETGTGTATESETVTGVGIETGMTEASDLPQGDHGAPEVDPVIAAPGVAAGEGLRDNRTDEELLPDGDLPPGGRGRETETAIAAQLTATETETDARGTGTEIAGRLRDVGLVIGEGPTRGGVMEIAVTMIDGSHTGTGVMIAVMAIVGMAIAETTIEGRTTKRDHR